MLWSARRCPGLVATGDPRRIDRLCWLHLLPLRGMIVVVAGMAVVVVALHWYWDSIGMFGWSSYEVVEEVVVVSIVRRLQLVGLVQGIVCFVQVDNQLRLEGGWEHWRLRSSRKLRSPHWMGLALSRVWKRFLLDDAAVQEVQAYDGLLLDSTAEDYSPSLLLRPDWSKQYAKPMAWTVSQGVGVLVLASWVLPPRRLPGDQSGRHCQYF